MAARLVLLCVGALAIGVPFAWASDSVESGAPMEPPEVVAEVATTAVVAASLEGGTQTICKPTISSRVSAKNRWKISQAFQVALERVLEVPECRELFAELGADGTDSLGRVVFLPVGREGARGNVCRRSSAYTLVGGGPIWVCREFSRLSDTQAAMVIIHEALHHAGLTEYPRDADGMTSRAINHMVMKRCGL